MNLLDTLSAIGWLVVSRLIIFKDSRVSLFILNRRPSKAKVDVKPRGDGFFLRRCFFRRLLVVNRPIRLPLAFRPSEHPVQLADLLDASGQAFIAKAFGLLSGTALESGPDNQPECFATVDHCFETHDFSSLVNLP